MNNILVQSQFYKIVLTGDTRLSVEEILSTFAEFRELLLSFCSMQSNEQTRLRELTYLHCMLGCDNGKAFLPFASKKNA